MTKQNGAAKRGYPVWEKMTMFDTNGVASFSTINEVVEFSSATLDASLFDVPVGYREVKDCATLSSPPPATPTTTETPAQTNTATTETRPETNPEPKPEPKPKSDPVKKINRALRWP